MSLMSLPSGDLGRVSGRASNSHEGPRALLGQGPLRLCNRPHVPSPLRSLPWATKDALQAPSLQVQSLPHRQTLGPQALPSQGRWNSHRLCTQDRRSPKGSVGRQG